VSSSCWSTEKFLLSIIGFSAAGSILFRQSLWQRFQSRWMFLRILLWQHTARSGSNGTRNWIATSGSLRTNFLNRSKNEWRWWMHIRRYWFIDCH
jgi:hypothetical protein